MANAGSQTGWSLFPFRLKQHHSLLVCGHREREPSAPGESRARTSPAYQQTKYQRRCMEGTLLSDASSPGQVQQGDLPIKILWTFSSP